MTNFSHKKLLILEGMKLSKLTKSAKSILAANIVKGELAEEIAKQDYIENGFSIHSTGIGSDFIAKKFMENKLHQEYVDVKSGNAKLTKKQKQTKYLLKKQNIPYSIYRVTDEYLEFYVEKLYKQITIFLEKDNEERIAGAIKISKIIFALSKMDEKLDVMTK